jgi:lysophospholipid hydrolase
MRLRVIAVLHIDASLEWVQLDAGQVLYRQVSLLISIERFSHPWRGANERQILPQGDVSDSIYIVVNGRLRALQDNEESSQVDTVAEHGQGESVGFVQL